MKKLKCPHCGGKLVKSLLLETYWDCKKCGRGWEIKGKLWIAHYDTAQNVYEIQSDGSFKFVKTGGVD